mmetsp:Transcript_48583/g.114721  ORF Transcript_48583/g.114721 Transcript_48583/m.114721 type:complete len:200 (-) Transcript_48583:227-826(-)
MLHWSEGARNLVARVELLRSRDEDVGAEAWPDMSEASLTTSVSEWMGPFLYGVTNRQQIAAVDVQQALMTLLSPEQVRLLSELCPEHVALPTGTRAPIDYSNSQGPTVTVALQEVLGTASLPALLGGDLPLSIALLNPGKRVIQITTDLERFWNGAYKEVRKEMRGRYPKHYWPEDPANAVPSTQTSKKQRAAKGASIE